MNKNKRDVVIKAVLGVLKEIIIQLVVAIILYLVF